jgi:hypothetical protein
VPEEGEAEVRVAGPGATGDDGAQLHDHLVERLPVGVPAAEPQLDAPPQRVLAGSQSGQTGPVHAQRGQLHGRRWRAGQGQQLAEPRVRGDLSAGERVDVQQARDSLRHRSDLGVRVRLATAPGRAYAVGTDGGDHGDRVPVVQQLVEPCCEGGGSAHD